MEMCIRFVGSLLCFLLAASFSGGVPSSDLCSQCDCQPKPASPIFVVCKDGSKLKTLRLTGGNMLRMQRTKNLTIIGYHLLTFEKNSFRQLTDLESLIVRNVHRATFNTGVFSTLRSLTIDRITDLWFMDKAFMGAADIKEILISNSNIAEVGQFAFYNMKGLGVFRLSNVTIDRLVKESIRLSLESPGVFAMKTCHIHATDESAVELNASTVQIRDSTFDVISKDGVQFTVENWVNITRCTFKKTDRFSITAPNVYISHNTFEMIDLAWYNDLHLGTEHSRFEFQDNVIQDVRLVENFNLMLAADYSITNNKIINCVCSREMTLDGWSAKIAKYMHILENNYCQSSCNISLFDLANDNEAYCENHQTTDGNLDGESYCQNRTEVDVPATEKPKRTGKEYPTSPTKKVPAVPFNVTNSRQSSSATGISMLFTPTAILLVTISTILVAN